MIRRVLVMILGFGLSLSAAGSDVERTIRAELSGSGRGELRDREPRGPNAGDVEVPSTA